jgi:hypothetical protein
MITLHYIMDWYHGKWVCSFHHGMDNGKCYRNDYTHSLFMTGQDYDELKAKAEKLVQNWLIKTLDK